MLVFFVLDLASTYFLTRYTGATYRFFVQSVTICSTCLNNTQWQSEEKTYSNALVLGMFMIWTNNICFSTNSCISAFLL